MVYVFIANGTEEVEAVGVVDVLRRAEVDVCLTGVNNIKIKSAHRIVIECDAIDSSISFEDMEAVVLTGGLEGIKVLEQSEHVQKAIDYAHEKHLLIAAICAAPSIIGHKQILENKNATCFRGWESQLLNANVKDEGVVIDDNIITAKSVFYVFDFALAILKKLRNETLTEKVESAIKSTKI